MDLEPLTIDRSGAAERHRRARRRSAIGWIAVVALVAVVAWFFRAPLGGLIDRVRLPAVSVIRVTRTTAAAAAAVSGTAANGYVVARTRAALSADTPGRIVEMNVTEGSVVKKGDVVARLYSDEYAAALRAAEAELSAVNATIDRSSADRAVTAAALEGARSGVASAEAALGEARATAGLARLNRERLEKLVRDRVESQQRLDEAVAEEERSSAAVALAQAQLETARRTLEQAEKQLTAADAALAEARAQLPVLEARREQAAATLDKTNVRAPFDGVVVLKDAEVGEVVSPNAQGGQSRGSIATMVDFATLEVQVELPETSLAAVAVGAPARIFLDAFPSRGYAGRVLRIWPTANRQKATVEIRVGFDEPDEMLRPEMGARVVFQGAEQGPAAAAGPAPGSILIPVACVVRIEGKPGAFVLERDVARFRQLRLGEEKTGRVLVESGLEEGERVVADPPDSLRDGDRVRVEET